MHAQRSLAYLIIVCGALVSGCGSIGVKSSSMDGEPGGLGTTLAGDSTGSSSTSVAESIGLPLQFFIEENARYQSALDTLHQKLVSECMSARGFSYRSTNTIDATAVSMRARYGIADVERVSEFGYYRPSVNFEGPEDPNVATADEVFYLALDGPEENIRDIRFLRQDGSSYGGVLLGSGCRASAQRSVFGSEERYVDYIRVNYLIQDLVDQARVAALASPDMGNVSKQWSECVASQGFTGFASPLDLQSQPWPDPRPGDEERAAATADARCKVQVGYVDAALAAEARAESELLQSTPGAVEQLQAFWADMRADMRSDLATVSTG